MICLLEKCTLPQCQVRAGSPSRGGVATVYVCDINHPSLPTPFLFWSCVYFCLCGPFYCISFHKFSRQLSVLPLCFSGLFSALLVLSATYLFMKVSFSPDIMLSGWLGSKLQLTNKLSTVPVECNSHGITVYIVSVAVPISTVPVLIFIECTDLTYTKLNSTTQKNNTGSSGPI